MISFSLKDGTPIALGKNVISRKKKKPIIIHIKENKEGYDPDINRELLKPKDFHYISSKDYEIILNALESGIVPKDENLRQLFYLAEELIKKKMKSEIYEPDQLFTPIPKIDTRECIYVSGPSGSGKSTYVSKYALNYKKLFPDNPIYLISRLGSDEVLDDIEDLHRIPITEDITDYEVKSDELEDSLVIFDDVDTFQNKKVKEFVYNLIDDLLQTGRHANTYICVTSHLLTNSHKTRIILNECHSVTLFPGRSTRHSLDYILTKYFGLKKSQVGKLCQYHSRWITVYKNPPMCLYEKGCVLLR